MNEWGMAARVALNTEGLKGEDPHGITLVNSRGFDRCPLTVRKLRRAPHL